MNKSRKIFLLILIPLIFLPLGSFWIENEITDIYLSNHSVFEDIRFSSYDEAQAVYLHTDENTSSYSAYMPGSPNTQMKVYFQHCTGIVINGINLSNGDTMPSILPEVPYLVQVYDKSHTIFEESYITFYFSDTLPSMHITTASGNMLKIHSDKEYSENASYILYTADGKCDSMGACSIKGRGNSSWGFEQKPYSITLFNDISLLGMGCTSDWALLNNYDESVPQLKTKVTFELAEKMGLSYTPQGEFVNLYLNGNYNGLYLLAQRINVDSSEYLLEFDARYEEEPVHFMTDYQRVVVKLPVITEEEQKNHIYNYLLETEAAMYSKNGVNVATGKSYPEYIDKQSWADIFTIHNFFCQWDIEYASFYLYKQKQDPLLYAGPVWDFDNSCGKMHVGYYPQLANHMLWIEEGRGQWLQALCQQDDFLEYANQRYLNILSPALSQILNEEYWNIVTPLSSAAKMDALRWNKNENDVQKEFSHLYEWLTERQAFLNDYQQNPETYCKVTFEFPWGPALYYAKENTSLGFLPLEKYGEFSKNESAYGFEKIIGWTDDAGNAIESDIVITKDTSFYAVWE